MRVVVTRIEPDGTMQRRVVDTAHRDGGPGGKTSPPAPSAMCGSTWRSRAVSVATAAGGRAAGAGWDEPLDEPAGDRG